MSTLEKRNKIRNKRNKKRADDAPLVFKKRIEIYKKHTEKLIQYFTNNEQDAINTTVISANNSIEQVHSKIMSFLNKT